MLPWAGLAARCSRPLRSRSKVQESDITDLMDSLMHAFRYFSSFRISNVIVWFLSGRYRCISSNSFCCLSGFFAKRNRSAAVEYAVCTESVAFVKMQIFLSHWLNKAKNSMGQDLSRVTDNSCYVLLFLAFVGEGNSKTIFKSAHHWHLYGNSSIQLTTQNIVFLRHKPNIKLS
jgi:hypothetical protein